MYEDIIVQIQTNKLPMRLPRIFMAVSNPIFYMCLRYHHLNRLKSRIGFLFILWSIVFFILYIVTASRRWSALNVMDKIIQFWLFFEFLSRRRYCNSFLVSFVIPNIFKLTLIFILSFVLFDFKLVLIWQLF